MGDYPTKQQQNPLELTNQIFGPATQHEQLRDETYCQIMKQMTSNNNRYVFFFFFFLSVISFVYASKNLYDINTPYFYPLKKHLN